MAVAAKDCYDWTPCCYCGFCHSSVGMCPRVKAIEYHENGAIKRVEFHGQDKPKPPELPKTSDSSHIKPEFSWWDEGYYDDPGTR